MFGAIMAVSLVGGTAEPSISSALAMEGLRNILWILVIAALAVATLALVVTRQRSDAAVGN